MGRRLKLPKIFKKPTPRSVDGNKIINDLRAKVAGLNGLLEEDRDIDGTFLDFSTRNGYKGAISGLEFVIDHIKSGDYDVK